MNIDISTLRWIAYTSDSQIVENHSHGRTWKKVYNDNHGNFKALCLQSTMTGEKYFVKTSDYNEYWTFEELEYNMAGNSRHISRSICSLRQANILDDSKDIWDVLTIDAEGVHYFELTSKDIGYNIRNFTNKEAWRI